MVSYGNFPFLLITALVYYKITRRKTEKGKLIDAAASQPPFSTPPPSAPHISSAQVEKIIRRDFVFFGLKKFSLLKKKHGLNEKIIRSRSS